MMRRSVMAALVVAMLIPTVARADFRQDYQHEIDTAAAMLGNSVSRARRSIAIGPHVGGLGGMASSSDGFGGVSFGLALYTFDIPTVMDLRAVIEEAVKTRVEARARALVAAGRLPSREELKQIALEVVAEVKAELFGDRTGKALEKPSFGVILEGVRMLGRDGWQARVAISKGIGPVSLALGGGYQHLAGDDMPLLGAELSLRLTPIGKERTPVLELYTRFDLGFANDDHPTSQIVGLRALLDVI